MTRLAIITALCLAGCATTGEKPLAATKAALAVELAYQAAGEAILAADTAGVIPASARPCIARLDTRAYGAVRLARVAYTADPTAIVTARSAVADLLSRKGC